MIDRNLTKLRGIVVQSAMIDDGYRSFNIAASKVWLVLDNRPSDDRWLTVGGRGEIDQGSWTRPAPNGKGQ